MAARVLVPSPRSRRLVLLLGCIALVGCSSTSGDDGPGGQSAADGSDGTTSPGGTTSGGDAAPTGRAGEGRPGARIAAGLGYACAVTNDGEVACWGSNYSAQLGTLDGGKSSVATRVPDLSSVVALAGGGIHVCALRTDGTVACWGDNRSFQSGGGAAGDQAPSTVPDVTDAIAIAAGMRHACAVTKAGRVRCWGDSASRQAGPYDPQAGTGVRDVEGIDDAVAIDAGSYHTCALRRSGRVVCWGSNEWGQLGDGTASDLAKGPVEVTGLTKATAISAGAKYTCAVVGSGEVECWGSNRYGELGVEPLNQVNGVPTPVRIPGLSEVVSIATSLADGPGTCAVDRGGKVRCWGYMGRDDDATGTIGFGPTAFEIPSIEGALDVAAGGGFWCARSANAVKCWGDNTAGAVGNGSSDKKVSTPAAVVGLP